MNATELNGCITVSTFISYDEDSKAGHSYLGVIQDDKHYNLGDEGNYYEVNSFNDISYVLDMDLDDDYATPLEEWGKEVSDIAEALAENLKELAQDEGYNVTRDGYTIDFWKDGKKIHSENFYRRNY